MTTKVVDFMVLNCSDCLRYKKISIDHEGLAVLTNYVPQDWLDTFETLFRSFKFYSSKLEDFLIQLYVKQYFQGSEESEDIRSSVSQVR